MYCRVTKLRRAGQRIPDGEAAPTLEGFLSLRNGVATLAPPLTQNVTLSELFAVSLVQVADGALILRGYEKDEARGVLQAWRCEPLDTRHGFDRMGRRITTAKEHAASESDMIQRS